jgi:hypothetical protein
VGVSLMVRRNWHVPSTNRRAAHVIVTVVDGESEEPKEVIGKLVAAG